MHQGLAYQAAAHYLTCRLPGLETPSTVRWRSGFYRKDGPCYRPVSDETVTNDLATWLARNDSARTDAKAKVQPITRSLVADVLVGVRAEGALDDATEPGTWLRGKPANAKGPFLATPGGVLDLGLLGGTPVLYPDSPDFFALAALPVTPDPAAPCDAWLRFLAETFPGQPDAVDLLQEVFGYCLLPDCRFERFFFLYGAGNTGKSTTAETLCAFLGHGNIVSVTLDRIGGRFALAALEGKLANVVFDLSEIDRPAEGLLKTLVSGEPVPVEQKHRPLTTQRLTAKQVFLSNVLPRFHDTSSGLWRRLVLVPFERECPEAARDPGLKGKLRDELPAVAWWALRGLARLLARGDFTPLARGAVLAEEYRKESNPVRLFLEAECVSEAGARVGRQDLYRRYRDWAGDNGMIPLASVRFYREVRALVPQPDGEPRAGRAGDRQFVGFRPRLGGFAGGEFRLVPPSQAGGA